MEIMKNEAGIARLKVSKASVAARQRAEGVEAGKLWALGRAKYDELLRVVEINYDYDTPLSHLCNLSAEIHLPLFDGATDAWGEGFIAGAEVISLYLNDAA